MMTDEEKISIIAWAAAYNHLIQVAKQNDAKFIPVSLLEDAVVHMRAQVDQG